MDLTLLPAVNAILNSICTVLLVFGYVFMRQKKIPAHRTCMTAAGIISAVFLASYLTYHFNVGHVVFTGKGLIRSVYLTILFTHVLLAVVIAVIVPMTFWRAYTGQIARHRSLARVTFPIWMYVSITGVVVYVMLYRM